MVYLLTYGTLMESESRNEILEEFGCKHVKDILLKYHKLSHFYQSCFPVAEKTKNENDKIFCEVYTLGYEPRELITTLNYIEGIGQLYEIESITNGNNRYLLYCGISNFWKELNQGMSKLPNGKKWCSTFPYYTTHRENLEVI